MPKHKPIKFKTTLDPGLLERIKWIMNKEEANSVLNATLGIIALGGMLTVTAIAPSLIGALGLVLKADRKERYREYNQIWQRFYKLKRDGSLRFTENENGSDVYVLTKKGEQRITKLVYEEMCLATPQSWDHKWRLVIFDVPEKKSKARKALVQKLKDLGFYQCQKSVWIHPFPCLMEIEFIKDTLNIKAYVKIFLIDEMTDGKVLYHFSELLKKVITKK